MCVLPVAGRLYLLTNKKKTINTSLRDIGRVPTILDRFVVDRKARSDIFRYTLERRHTFALTHIYTHTHKHSHIVPLRHARARKSRATGLRQNTLRIRLYA